ncbi:hypothetical protein [Saccharothrix sp.]|uniref:hypothetical protein n=1 Tax=Saccharothrix sp. TaxID=1873460 RepID=UPI002811225C|nr:hypothetical protein [Saccharothrix sp.]
MGWTRGLGRLGRARLGGRLDVRGWACAQVGVCGWTCARVGLRGWTCARVGVRG